MVFWIGMLEDQVIEDQYEEDRLCCNLGTNYCKKRGGVVRA